MAALLVGMAVSAVLLTVAMPVWKQTATREKEAELVFRGRQYMRAIGLFQRRNGPGVLPPSTQVLVDQRFLRKKFTDPITGGPFLVLPGAAPAQGATTQLNTASAGRGTPARGSGSGTPPTSPLGGRGAANQGTAAVGAMEEPKDGSVPGGIAGVVSKSPDESLYVFNGRTHYNEWEFRFIAPPQAPQGGDGRGGPGERGQQPPGGFGPGGRGPDGRGGPGGRAGTMTPDGRGGFIFTTPDGRTQTLPPGVSMPNPRGGSLPPVAPGPQRGR